MVRWCSTPEEQQRSEAARSEVGAVVAGGWVVRWCSSPEEQQRSEAARSEVGRGGG